MYNCVLRYSLVSIVILSCVLVSCTSPKKVVYFYDLQDSTALGLLSNAKLDFENKIQKNDQLWISVGGSNPLDLSALNSANGVVPGASTSISAEGSNSTLGYFVEADGNIQLPYVGKVKAEGLTRLELQNTLTVLFKDYTKNPVVNVRFLNYSYSVLGEVNRSGKFNMVTERTTILDAISSAGDITVFGKRDNVLLVREENGKRTFARINLLSKEIFKSPYYYLRTNDVVYVEPVSAKFITRTGVPQYLSIVAVGLTLVLTIITVSK